MTVTQTDSLSPIERFKRAIVVRDASARADHGEVARLLTAAGAPSSGTG